MTVRVAINRWLSLMIAKKAILRQGAWVAAGQVMSALGALVAIRVMTELLSPDVFGRLTLLVGIAALALGLSNTPVVQALMRYYPEFAKQGGIGPLRRVGARLARRQAGIATLVLALGWLVFGARWDQPLVSALLVISLLLIDAIRMFEIGLLSAARRQKSLAVIQAVDAWMRPLAAVAAVVLMGPSAEAALAGYLIGAAVAAALALGAVRREGRDDPASATDSDEDASIKRESATMIRRYALPLMPLALLSWISGMGDRYLIGGLLGLEEVGLYAAAYGLASRPFLMLQGIVELTLRPVLQNAIADRDQDRIARAKRAFILVTTALASGGVLAFALLSDWAATLLLAEPFRQAAALMPWIALGYGLYSVSNVFARFCYAFDDTRGALILTATGAVLGLLVMAPAVWIFGLAGAAGAVSVSFATQLAISVVLAKRAEARYLAISRSHSPAASADPLERTTTTTNTLEGTARR